MKKNRVLFILHLPPPVHGSAMVGQYIKDSKLVENAFDTRFINLSTSLTIDEIGKNPIVKVSRYFKIVFKLIKYLLGFKPETVYLAITAKGLGFYKDLPIALLVKIFGKKLVLHYHNKGVLCRQSSPFDNLLYQILFKNSKVILLSKSLYNDIAKYVAEEDVFFCPNGIPDVNNFNNNTLTKNGIPQFLFLSNLIESKGVFVLLDAIVILKKKGLKFNCNIVGGEGDILIGQLNRKIKDLQLESFVHYLGKKYKEEKWVLFQSSHCFVLPTYYHNECFPLVLLEAMMFGLPLISTSEGGIPDIINCGETGFIVEKQNPHSLAERMKYFIENMSYTQELGNKSRSRFLNNYTLDIFENRLIDILNKI